MGTGTQYSHYYCARCRKYCPATAFYKCALAKKARRCKRHWQRAAYKQRMPSPLGRMLLSVRARLNAAGEPELARAWELSDVEAVLRRFGHRAPYDKLCIVGIDGVSQHVVEDDIYLSSVPGRNMGCTQGTCC